MVDDITIADRIILLDKGRKLFDGKQEELKKRFGKYAILELYFKPEAKVNYAKYEALGEVFSKKDGYIGLKVDPDITKSDAFASIFKDEGIEDYRLSEPGLSSILESTYEGRIRVFYRTYQRACYLAASHVGFQHVRNSRPR